MKRKKIAGNGKKGYNKKKGGIIMQELLDKGETEVLGAIYDIESGEVNLLEE